MNQVKVCIPTMGYRGFDEEIGRLFWQVPTYTIIDTDTHVISIIENTSDRVDGLNLNLKILAKYGTNAIICHKLISQAIMLFNQHEIKVFTGARDTVRNAYALWKDNKFQDARVANDLFKENIIGSYKPELGISRY